MKLKQMQLMSLEPDPPVAGEDVEICYDFGEVTFTEVVVKVTFEPNGSPTSYKLTDVEKCVTVAVPSDATKITVEDCTGPSPDLVRAVSPNAC